MIRKTINTRPIRKRKKIIVLGTEGNNKSELLYFCELEKEQKEYHFIFAKGNYTDPIGIINSTAKQAKKENIKCKYGDFAAAGFDIDVDNQKISNINAIIDLAQKKNVQLFTSNPCFELWYIYHFTYTTKSYNSSQHLIKELQKYMPNYEKNRCDFNILKPLTYEAIANAKQAQKKVKSFNPNNNYMTNNPNTDIFILVERVLPKLKKGGKV